MTRYDVSRRAISRLTAGIGALAVMLAAPATGYVGDSYVRIPGMGGQPASNAYDGWIRIEAHYWKHDEDGLFAKIRRGGFSREKKFYSTSGAPQDGPEGLVLSLAKESPALPGLMKACADGATVPEMTFAESAALGRGLRELGPRPDAIPAFFEYRLKDARIASCPVAAEAPEQAFVISFADIDWTNYSGDPKGVANPLSPPVWPTLELTGESRTFVVPWFAYAFDVSEDQCSGVNARPPQDAFYELLPSDVAAKERVERDANGGVGYENGEMERRGPERLNATLLPGIVRDPGLITPSVKFARGLDLDNHSGKGRPAAGTCRHENFSALDGRAGIDNQLFRVFGCIKGHMGHRGFHPQYANEQRRNGMLSVLVRIDGIDDFAQDDEVYVSILYSLDKMTKNADGKLILADYTYRLTDNPEYSYYAFRFRGRIEDGTVVTDRVEKMQVNLALDSELTLHHAGMRLRFMEDGSLKGVLGGYQDWRKILMVNGSSTQEVNYGLSVPGIYNALRRYADGMKDPVTGQCNGISSAYDIEGVPAFLPPAQSSMLVVRPGTGGLSMRR